MLTRRIFARLLPAMSAYGIAAKPKLPEGGEILKSFDARDWAKAFVAHVQQIPSIATDEETITSWFANALMRGYDEHASKYPCAGTTSIEALEHQVRGAVARGWCADANREKVMDTDLAEAITQEIVKLRG